MPPTAMILTHGHEDHIGAFPFFHEILPEGLDIYLSDFTQELVLKKLKFAGLSSNKFNFHLIETNTEFTVKDFKVNTFFMPHSIPSAFSVGLTNLETKQKLYFTSDFKINGRESRFKIEDIKKFGPVDFMFTDSTGALSKGQADDERDVLKNIEQVIDSCSSRIFITTFSSHIERVVHLIKYGQAKGYTIATLGMSLKSNLKSAFYTGHLDQDPKQFSNASAHLKKVIWLISGCQAEERSSLYRLAFRNAKDLIIKEGDTFIYAASKIPGNEAQVYKCLNEIAYQGAKVIGVNQQDPMIHASGHGKQEDIRILIDALQPKNVVPVHGDPIHFHAFKSIIDSKINVVNVPDNKHIYELDETLLEHHPIDVDFQFVDGKSIHDQMSLYGQRKTIGKEGICNIILENNDDKMRLILINQVGIADDNSFLLQLPELEDKVRQILPKTELLSESQKKKLKEKIYMVCDRLFHKKPFINLILI